MNCFKLYATFILLFISSSMFAQQTNFDAKLRDVSQRINNKLSKSGINKVAVTSFTDLQGNVTELGRYLAEQLSIELSNTDLQVIDRSKMDSLKSETIYSDTKQVAKTKRKKSKTPLGIDYYITGTMALLDNSIDVTIKVIDYHVGVLTMGDKVQFERTDAINNLLGNPIRNNGSKPGNLNIAKKIDTHGKSSVDDLFEATTSPLRKSECSKKWYNEIVYYGQICFENQTGEDLIFYCDDFNPGERLDDYKVVMPNGARNCSRLIAVNWTQRFNVDENESKEVSFTFLNTEKNKRAKLSFIVDKGMVKSFVLAKNNLTLIKN